MNEHTLYSGLTSDPCEEVLKWKHPFTCIEIPQSISCHYGEFQQWMMSPEYSSINFIEGLPDMTSLDPTKVNLLIIDDLMHEMNEVVAKLFTKGGHHRNTSVLLLVTTYIPSKQTF